MTWIDGGLMFALAAVAAYALFLRLEVVRQRADVTAAREELTQERDARAQDRDAVNTEREVHLYDHRQLVSRRLLVEGVPPLDEPLKVGEDATEEFDEETEEGIERALASLGGGRMRGAGRIAHVRDEYDRLMTKRDEVRASRTNAGTPRNSSREPQSPYTEGERALTSEDYAAIDDAAH